jgi:signal transduction histidine kinase
MVGHDIRNPLQAIVGDLYLIENDVASLPEGETKEGLQESVKSIQDNLQYIAKIVEDLQDYAKPLKPNFERVRIDKVIEDVMLLMRNVTSNHRVIIDVEEGFPEIVTDFSMLKRALTNLTQNAIQAMPNGGQLTLRANHKGTRLFICVEDSGGGIPEEVKPKLFTPMVTTKAKGQGLGLAVVKRLSGIEWNCHLKPVRLEQNSK